MQNKNQIPAHLKWLAVSAKDSKTCFFDYFAQKN